MSKKTSEAVQAAADAGNDPGALSAANQTEPRVHAPDHPSPQPPADNGHVAEGAEPFPEVAAPPSDELLRAHQRINLLEEDIAFLRATYGWPTKDRT